MNDITAPAGFNANTTTTPVGVSGAQRDNYLSLTHEQRRIYRYNYDVCGRLAAHCYKIAVGA